MSEPLRLLVDSCVWIDSYLGDHPRHDESFEFVRTAYAVGAQLLYGASKLESIFYILVAEAKRLVRHEKGSVSESDAAAARSFAWGCVENIRSIATAVGVDESVIWLADKYRAIGSDLEDNMLLASAQRCKADYIVTWDAQVLRSPLAKTADPTDMVALLSIEQ